MLADDNVLVTPEFEDGSRGSVTYSALGADRMPKELVEITGSGRSAVIDNFRRVALYGGTHVSTHRGRQDKGHDARFQTLVRAVSAGGPAPVPAEEFSASALATLCVAESLAPGAPTRLAEQTSRPCSGAPTGSR